MLETDLLGNPQSEYVFFGGQRVARRDVSGVQSLEYYYFANQIHSTALITDVNGNIEDDADYYPWGGTLQFSSNLANHYWFSGKERDAETGLDYFGARYYGNTFGRFTTPDWSAKVAGIPYADFGDPQSLNLYGYVRNNPIVKVDPDGHQEDEPDTPGDTVDKNGEVTGSQGAEGAETMERGRVEFENEVKQQDEYEKWSNEPAGPGVLDSNHNDPVTGRCYAPGATNGDVMADRASAAGDAGRILGSSTLVPDAHVVVRGGTGEMPAAGTTFSGAHGATEGEAASGVPHGTIRTTTAGAIREGGGTVESVPERTRSGAMNDKHVNVTEGKDKPSTFSEPKPNPVPKNNRIQ